MDPLTKPQRVLVTLLSVALLATCGYGLYRAFSGPSPYWAVFGFEVIALSCVVCGVLIARGKLAEGRAMALATIAGMPFVGVGLGLVSMGVPWRTVLTNPWFLSRVVLAGGFAIVAAWSVFGSNTKLWRTFLLGLSLAVGSLGAAAAAWLTRGMWFEPTSGAMRIAVVTMALCVTVALGGLFSAGVHFSIRAFELGDRGRT